MKQQRTIGGTPSVPSADLRLLSALLLCRSLTLLHWLGLIGEKSAVKSASASNCFLIPTTALASLVQKLQQLSAESSSPLIGPLEQLLKQSGGLSVVMRNPRMNQAVAAYFAGSANLRNAKVVSAMQLRGAHMCNVLVAIGPCGWHPEYIFSAPRRTCGPCDFIPLDSRRMEARSGPSS